MNQCQHDDFLCQVCTRTGCGVPACRNYLATSWVPGAGNVCSACKRSTDKGPRARLSRHTMTTGIQATIASAYADGVCMACETPERGVLVTLLDIALPAPVAREGGGCSVAAQGRLLLTLCWEHHNLLRDQLNKLGERREI